ncbi:PadR family transcriptional regulator [Natronorubrum tibetense]|uniref:PadR family transcriptional regulator n=1 Tax=Natronorubrum tibetense GA33 TaxID=1114856 RepID=L9VP40_9EURY|nr:helix-turn-helix transcriptional regulator [Natronorubrum tibetense]ELY38924.1 hypothetical protein C496_16072 [Natronorubrum tibetense GA33]
MEQRELASLAILGILAEKERATVKTVHEKLRHNFGRYWGASTGILVPTVNQLNDDGYVKTTDSTTQAATYKITDEGRNHLQSLLTKPIEDVSHPSFRAHLMMKLGFLHHLSIDGQQAEIRALKDQLKTAREELRTIDAAHESEVDDRERVGYRQELIDLRVRILDTFLEWLDAIEPSQPLEQ